MSPARRGPSAWRNRASGFTGHYAPNLYPGTRVRCVSSEEFTNEFNNSIRDGKG
ncbi:hypothetical protein [Streptomyces sp. NPDC005407]|uniref:hypothetical protein n=1 Tax=Streptomyces sp. NPDC005407 TaxID=3155340 RepID=UPI0033BCC6DB